MDFPLPLDLSFGDDLLRVALEDMHLPSDLAHNIGCKSSLSAVHDCLLSCRLPRFFSKLTFLLCFTRPDHCIVLLCICREPQVLIVETFRRLCPYCLVLGLLLHGDHLELFPCFSNWSSAVLPSSQHASQGCFAFLDADARNVLVGQG